MRLRRVASIVLAFAPWPFLIRDAFARDLTFKDRIDAQVAIDRVYYSHQTDADRPFSEALPRRVAEDKVRNYLKETAALETRWHTLVTAEMLHAEVERMVHQTRMPDRLGEIFAALGNDAFLIEECLARPVVVDRLARASFASEQAARATSRSPERPQGQWRRRRSQLFPQDAVRRVSLPWTARGRTAESGASVVPIDSPSIVAAQSWSEWWSQSAAGFDERGVEAAARVEDPSPVPRPVQATSCPPDQTWDVGSMAEYLSGRVQHTAIWTGSLMVIWGGWVGGYNDGFFSDTGVRYDPATDTWSPTSHANAPGPRAGHTAVWTGTQMVIWGGYEYSTTLATGGRYDPINDLWVPISTANAPEPRDWYSTVWTGSRMIVWGGWTGSDDLASGRSYDPVSDVWTATSLVNAPEARDSHSAVWTGQRMLIWGGEGIDSLLDSGGSYDPATDTWSAMSAAGAPSGRLNQGAVWSGHYLTVWGGVNSSGHLNTGGRYDPATDTWLPMTTTNAPEQREVDTAPLWTGSRMLIFGGWDGRVLDTGGRYDPEADIWSPMSTLDAPVGRDFYSAVWTGSRMLVWGGVTDYDLLADGGRYDPSSDSWTPLSGNYRPLVTTDAAAVWTGNEMIVWGGDRDPNYFPGTGARYDPALDTWRPVTMLNAPGYRVHHTAVWTGQYMVVWGGNLQTTFETRAAGGRYDPLTDSWLPVSTISAPVVRESHGAVWTGTRMVIWGGISAGFPVASGGIYDPVNDKWFGMSSVNAPAARSGAGTVWTGTRMIVWGGSNLAGILWSGGRYDPATDRWEAMSATNAPSPRSGPSTVWTGRSMILWGGSNSGVYLNSGGVYDAVADAWSPTTTTGAPSARVGHTAVWNGTRMIVWGGYSPPAVTASGGIYDPIEDAWIATSPDGAPSARSHHAAVWTGRFMVVWGGDNNSNVDQGGRFAYGLFADADHDGYTICGGDCDDGRAEVYPGAPEICDGLDNDCNGRADEPQAVSCDDANDCTTDSCAGFLGCRHPIRDRDGDGAPDGLCGGNDCDDRDPLIFPGAPERCNGLDDSCDGVIDEGGALLCVDNDICTDDVCGGLAGCLHPARDNDGDGHGDATCGGNDCDDGNPRLWSSAVEVTGLSVAGIGATSILWDDQGTQVGPDILYLVVSGSITSSGSNDFPAASCLSVGDTPFFSDARPNPPLGTAYWFLARAVNSCGLGTYGTPARDANILACF